MFDSSALENEDELLDLEQGDEDSSEDVEDQESQSQDSEVEESDVPDEDEEDLGITATEDEEEEEEDTEEDEEPSVVAVPQPAKPVQQVLTPEIASLIDQTVATQLENAQGNVIFYKRGVESSQLELAEAKAAVKSAYDRGESGELATAQEKLANAAYKLNAAQSSLQHAERTFGKAITDPEGYKTSLKEGYVSKFAKEAPVIQQPVESPSAIARRESWLKKNTWFDVNKPTSPMTATALAIHNQLASTGVELGSSKYWALLDKGMQKQFPNKLKSAQSPVKKTPVAVAPAVSRAPQQRPNADKQGGLKLSKEEIAQGKRLGLKTKEDFQEYAKNLQAAGRESK